MASFLLLADFLSLITISCSLILKFPQIVNIYKLKSACGISIYGLLLELSSYTTKSCYSYVNNYPLLSYMEYPILIFQEVILVFLVLKYKNMLNIYTMSLAALYFAITISFMVQLIPSAALMFIVPLSTPVALSSKMLQLLEIFRTGKSDTISTTTWCITAYHNFNRVVTTLLMNSADKILLTNFLLQGTLSSCIILAAKYFQSKKRV